MTKYSGLKIAALKITALLLSFSSPTCHESSGSATDGNANTDSIEATDSKADLTTDSDTDLKTDSNTGLETDSETDMTSLNAVDYTRAAGLIALEPRQIDITYPSVLTLRYTTEARIFYAFVPADEHPEEKPVLVIFNGGPGAATTCNLFLFGSGPYVLDESSGVVAPNPYSFSTIANLIYIDTRQAGFSYDVSPEGNEDTEQSSEYILVNFNPYTEAADLLFVTLEVLKAHPMIKRNPIVFMAESYGGARATAMLDLVRRPSRLRDSGSPYRDETLALALEAHFAEVFPEFDFDALTPEQASSQFDSQVLIQPGAMLAPYTYMHPSCDYYESSDVRHELCSNGNDALDLRREAGFAALMFSMAEDILLSPSSFETLFGIAPESIPGLSADKRIGAFRVTSSPPETPHDNWNLVMGKLAPPDRYFVPAYNVYGQNANGVGRILTETFVSNLVEVHTFITRAYWDYAVVTALFPDALTVTSAAMENPPIAKVDLNTALREGVARPGWMNITFNDFLGLKAGTVRTVRMPEYLDSGHMAALTQAGDLREDISAFLGI